MYGIRDFWEDSTARNFEQSDCANGSFLKSTPELHIMIRNWSAYFFTDSAQLSANLRHRFELPAKIPGDWCRFVHFGCDEK